jgi:hypothetical protein
MSFFTIWEVIDKQNEMLERVERPCIASKVGKLRST